MWLKNIKGNKAQVTYTTLFILIITCGCLLYPELPWGHDGIFHLSRISSLKDAILLNYDFPVKIYPNYFNNAGYGNGLFYPDLFLYLPALISCLGISVITSYKLLLVGCTLLTFLFMYKCSKAITNSHKAALISALAYTMSGYRLYDIYVREALGEILALTFIPLAFYGFYHIIWKDERQWPLFVIGFSSILLSHIISSVLFIILLIIICCIYIKHLLKNKKRLGLLFLSCLTTLLLVAYFYFPMIEQLYTDKFVLNTQTVHSDLSQTTYPLFYLFLDISLGIPFNITNVSGIGILALIIIPVYSINYKKYKINNYIISTLFWLAILFTIPVSHFFPWESIKIIFPYFSTIQFAWRFYIIAVFLFSLIIGYILSQIKYKHLYKTLLVFYSIIAFYHISIIYAYFIYSGIIGGNTQFTNYTIGVGEYLPSTTNKELLGNNTFNSNNEDIILDIRRQNEITEISYINSHKNEPIQIETPILFYKGYKAILKDTLLSINKSRNGFIEMTLPNNVEKGKILISYVGTTVQKITHWISFISLLIFSLYIILKRKTIK